jgi:hypothetical protein
MSHDRSDATSAITDVIAIQNYIARAMNARSDQGLPDEIQDSETLNQLVRLMNGPRASAVNHTAQSSRGAA